MDKKHFIKICTEYYDFDLSDSDSEETLIITKCKKTNIDTYLEIHIAIYDDSYSIYKEFLYEDYNTREEILYITQLELLTLQELKKLSSIDPMISCDEYMGCPFYLEKVGFFEMPFNELQIKIIFDIFSSLESMLVSATIDKAFMLDHYPDELDELTEMQDAFQKELEDLLIKNGFVHIKQKKREKVNKIFSSSDKLYMNSMNTILVGFSEETQSKALEIFNYKTALKHKINEIYYGKEYFFGKVSNAKTICGNVNYINNMKTYLHTVYGESCDIFFSTDSERILTMKCYDFWAIICLIIDKNDEAMMIEYDNLQKKLNDLKIFLPKQILKEKFNLQKLTAGQYELMCRDILAAKGFKNIITRGNTNAADGGVDIEADEEVQCIMGIEKRHWIFQCKHTKKQIDRRDICEINELISEFNADKYGLFYSGLFTPSTIDRLKSNEKVAFWGKSEIELLLNDNPEIVKTYL